MRNEYKRGDVLANRYEVERLIASGGVGKVYLTRDWKEGGDTVAVKMLAPYYLDDSVIYDRFCQEFAVCKTLKHPNIIQVFELDSHEGMIFITMEYVEGSTLTELLKDQTLPVPVITWIVSAICDGLGYAHQRQVIHRDLKPDNVLITKEGVLRLTDFGLARQGGGRRLTQQGETVGTPAYMSPEQLEGKVSDGRSDIYSLGIMAYELAVGAPPFLAEEYADIARQHMLEPLPKAQAARPDLPDWFESFISRCAAKKADDRFSSCEDALQFIRKSEHSAKHSKSNEDLKARVTRISQQKPEGGGKRRPRRNASIGRRESSGQSRAQSSSRRSGSKSGGSNISGRRSRSESGGGSPKSSRKSRRAYQPMLADPVPLQFRQHREPRTTSRKRSLNFLLITAIAVASVFYIAILFIKTSKQAAPPPASDSRAIDEND